MLRDKQVKPLVYLAPPCSQQPGRVWLWMTVGFSQPAFSYGTNGALVVASGRNTVNARKVSVVPTVGIDPIVL